MQKKALIANAMYNFFHYISIMIEPVTNPTYSATNLDSPFKIGSYILPGYKIKVWNLIFDHLENGIFFKFRFRALY